MKLKAKWVPLSNGKALIASPLVIWCDPYIAITLRSTLNWSGSTS